MGIPEKIEIAGKVLTIKPVANNLYRVLLRDDEREEIARLISINLEGATLEIIPDYLELPLLVKFIEAIQVLPGQEVTYYFRIPLKHEVWIKWSENKRVFLMTVTPAYLKVAWIGPLHEGELAYFYQTEVICDIEQIPEEPTKIYVPLRVVNNTKETSTLHKVVIDSYQLSVYDVNARILTEVVKIEFNEEAEEVLYTDEPPVWDAKLIKKGQETVKEKGLARIAKRSLRSLLLPRIGL